MSNKQKIFYEVWSRDTFANESFLCETFTTRDQAERYCGKKEKEVAGYQDEELRDTFWVVEITDREIEARNRRDEEIEAQKREDSFYDHTRLRSCAKELITQFGERLQGCNINELLNGRNKKSSVRILQHEVFSDNQVDCFEKLMFLFYYCGESTPYIIVLEVCFKERHRSGSGSISRELVCFETFAEMIEWFNSGNAIDYTCEIISEFVDRFYRD